MTSPNEGDIEAYWIDPVKTAATTSTAAVYKTITLKAGDTWTTKFGKTVTIATITKATEPGTGWTGTEVTPTSYAYSTENGLSFEVTLSN